MVVLIETKREKEKFMTTSKPRQFKRIFYRTKPSPNQQHNKVFKQDHSDKRTQTELITATKPQNKTKFYSTPGRNSYHDLTKTHSDKIWLHMKKIWAV